MQLLPFGGMYTEEVQDTLQETDVLRLNFTWAIFNRIRLESIKSIIVTR